MPLIALTGGIASGKSTVAARLAAHGAVVVDADAIAREVVEPGEPALRAVRQAFGPDVLTADGTLDRAALARIVFTDEEQRRLLNGIVHPAVLERSRAAFREALRARADAVVVYDVPLIDSRGTDEFDGVVVVEAPEEIRVQRLMEHRGLARGDAEARIAAQMGDEERRALATQVIDTGGTLDETLAAADALWDRLAAS